MMNNDPNPFPMLTLFIWPDQLTRNDIGGEQVLVEQASSEMMFVAGSFLVLTFNELWSASLLCHCTSFVPKPQAAYWHQILHPR